MKRRNAGRRVRKSPMHHRRCRLERLEDRRLLAAEILFADSFESGSNSNDWAGNWVEDSQNDWFRSTQRATDGVRSAEVDGSANDATLTLSNSIDLSGYDDPTLTFDWLIESGFDRGEFLALDVSSDGGSSWTDVRRLNGNSDPENTWHSEVVDLSAYVSSDLLVRFRSQVSHSSEDANVDNVSIVGTPADTTPLGLVSHWTAENNTLDLQGRNNGSPVGGVSYAPGQIGQAFSFDGVDDRVIVPDSYSLRLTRSMTIEAWIKADSIPAPGQQGEIFFRGDDRGGLDPYSLSLQPDGRLRFEVVSLTDATNLWAPMPIGEFVHVAATLDDASGAMRLYLNGLLVSQTTTSVRPFGALDPGSNPGIGIGNHGGYPNTPHNFPFDGLIDDLKVYDVPLSDLEVLASFYAGNGSLQPSISINDESVVEGDSGYAFTDAFVSAGDGGLLSPRGLALGPDGNLYVSSTDTDSVLRYDGTTGAFIDEFVTAGAGGLDFPFDLAFQNGDLFVVSAFTNSVLRFNGTTGAFVDEFVAAGSGGLEGPRGLLFGTNNDLYVTSTGEDDAILRYNATTGAFVDEFVASADHGLNNPTSIALGPDGNFYISSTNASSNSVLRYDSAGDFIDTFVGSGSGGLDGPADILFADGLMYVTSPRSDSVLAYDQNTGDFRGAVVFSGSGGLDNPNSMLLDNDGRLYVSSRVTNEVLRYAETSSAVLTVSLSWPSPETISVEFATADGTAAAGSDYEAMTGTVTFAPGVTSQTIWIPILEDTNVELDETFDVNLSNPVNASIDDATGEVTIVERRLSVDDVTVSEGDTTAHYRGGFVVKATGNFNDLTFGPDGNLYTSPGPSQGAIDRYDGQSGAFLGAFVNDSRISGTRDIVFRDGYMYVGSEYTDEVLRYNATTGEYVDTFVTSGSGGIDGPHGLAFGLDTNGDGISELYVTGRNSFNVVRYDGATGQPLGALDTSGGGALISPEGISIEPNGVAYVASSGSNKVQKYDSVSGTYLGAITSSQLNTPKAVRFGPADGLMYVASAGNDRILRFDSAGNYVDDFVPGGSGGMDNPYRMEFGPDGNLYVSALGTSHILRFGTDLEAVFSVTLSSPSSEPVTVDYTTSDGSAVAGDDYTAVSGTLVFEPGVISRIILVPIIDDAVYESTETFAVNLLASSGVGIQDSQGIGEIIDNDVPNAPPVVDAGTDQTLSDGDGTGAETVVIVGSAIDSDGSVVAFEWTEGTTVLGNAATLTTTLSVGVHTLTLTATDNQGATSSDTVIVTVLANQAPTANAGADISVKDTDGSGDETVTLDGSGFDPDGDIASYQWTNGANVLGNTASISPSLAVGTHTLTLTVTDNGGLTSADTVTVVVEANEPPVANDQTVAVKENTSKAITLSGSDDEGDPLTYIIQSGPTSGTLTGTAPNLTYTPDPGFTGPDSFTFLINDGINDSHLATVTISVADNLVPVADPQSVSVGEDGSLAITLSGSDPDGDPISYVRLTDPTSGTLTGTIPNLIYTPAANFNGSDSFTFLVNDGTDDSAVATVSIEVTPVNDPPVAFGQSLSTDEDTSAAITLGGSDLDGDALDFVIVDGPAGGSLSGSGANRIYTPDANFNGADSFTFRANDGVADSAVVTVSLTVNPVNDAPVAQGDNFTVDQDTPLSVPASGVLGNDGDVDGDLLSAVAWSGSSAQGGQVVLNSDGSFSYTPPSGFIGIDSFDYSASDGLLESGLATVTIDVTEANQNAIYVYDIRFESRYWGWQNRAVFEIRSDSNGDGQGSGADQVAAGVQITVQFGGQTYSGVTDSNGIFRTSWIWSPGSGSYANVVDLALADYEWNPLALDLEDDSDGDGRPDNGL